MDPLLPRFDVVFFVSLVVVCVFDAAFPTAVAVDIAVLNASISLSLSLVGFDISLTVYSFHMAW